MRAAGEGHAAMVRMILTWPLNAPRATCRDSWALVCAAGGGHDEVVRMLLTWPHFPPRADCQVGGGFRVLGLVEELTRGVGVKV